MASNFNNKKKYKNSCEIFSPHGIILEGTILTGKQWKGVLVYEVGNSFNEMFEEVTEENENTRKDII
jgi:hypothetical protein